MGVHNGKGSALQSQQQHHESCLLFCMMALALLFSADDVSCWRRRRRFGIEKAAPRKRGQAMFDFVDKVENEPEDQQKEFEDNNVLVSDARSFPEDDEDEVEELMEQVET